MGLRRETLATIAIDVARNYGVDAQLLKAWETIAASYAGIYRVTARSGDLVSLCELITDESRQVELIDDIPGAPGDVWWARLLPPMPGEAHWTAIATPYVFRGPAADRPWLDYFARQLGDTAVAKRIEAYRRLMKHGAKPTAWLDFIVDAYAGVLRHAVVLTGVPDRPETLPHSLDNEGEDNDAPHEPVPALVRVRHRLTSLAREDGAAQRSVAEFGDARARCGLADAGVEDWGPYEQMLLAALTMYGAPGHSGSSALQRLAGDLDGIADDERAAVAALQAGWFSLFEVVRVKIDVGLELRDVLRRKRLWVSERSGSRHVALGDLVASWIMREQDEVFFEGSVAQVPRMWASRVIAQTRDVNGQLRRRGWKWKRRHDALAPHVSAIIARTYRDRPPPAPDTIKVTSTTYAVPADGPVDMQAVKAQLLTEHLHAWLDNPIPALNNKTPRRAVRSSRGRDDVSAMLLEQERILRRGSHADRIDFAPLWSSLGLDYPGPTVW